MKGEFVDCNSRARTVAVSKRKLSTSRHKPRENSRFLLQAVNCDTKARCCERPSETRFASLHWRTIRIGCWIIARQLHNSTRPTCVVAGNNWTHWYYVIEKKWYRTAPERGCWWVKYPRAKMWWLFSSSSQWCYWEGLTDSTTAVYFKQLPNK